MRKIIRKVFIMWLTVGIVIAMADISPQYSGSTNKNSTVNVKAATSSDSLQNQIDDAQAKQNQLEKKKEQLKKEIADIEDSKDDMKTYIKKCDDKLIQLQDEMDSNKKNLKEQQATLDDLNEELAEDQSAQQKQHDTMFKRIQYMYENSNTNYFDILLTSDSIADMLNNAEYIKKITEYDNSLLINYEAVCLEVSNAKDEISQKLAELTDEREELKAEKESIEELLETKQKQIKTYQSQYDEANNDMSEYNEQIVAAENEVESLLQQQRDEIAAQENDSNTTVNTNVSASGFAWPLPVAGTITSTFGYRNAPTAGASTYHQGIDIAVAQGTSVLASKAGKVVTATYSSSAGNYIAVYHGSGQYTYYMHCSTLYVAAGDTVKQGQVMGKSGSTGVSTGPHLHFGVYINGSYVNPLNYVSR